MDGRLRNMTAIYLTSGSKILLLYRQGGRVVNNVWTGSAGGHFEQDELNDPRTCVLRELREETGLTEDKLGGLSLRYICLRNTKGEIRQNYYFFAELERDMELTSNEGILQWFELDQLWELEMPFSAREMILHYLDRGRFDEKLYSGVSDGTKLIFTELAEN